MNEHGTVKTSSDEKERTAMGTITVSRSELGNAVMFAALGLHKRPVLPVLGGMRVTVSCGTLELSAFDYETAARAKVSGQADGPGTVLVTGTELIAAVKSLPRGKNVTADILVDSDGLIIACEGTETLLAGMGAEAEAEYPELPSLPDQSGLIEAEAFKRSAARVAACAGTDDTLPVLLCVKVTGEAGMLELAATDRYRLGVDRLHWTGPDGVAANVPARMLVKFATAADKGGKVTLHLGEQHAGMSDGTRTLIVRTNCGDFPRYRALIRKDSDNTTAVLVHAPSLEAAAARAAKLSGPADRTGFEISEAGITVTAVRDGQVAGTQVVAAVFTGPALETGFNAGYLASVLSGIDGEAWIGLNGALKPAQVTSPDGFTAVIMPVRKPE